MTKWQPESGGFVRQRTKNDGFQQAKNFESFATPESIMRRTEVLYRETISRSVLGNRTREGRPLGKRISQVDRSTPIRRLRGLIVPPA